jgi:hypothetical protein
MCLPGTTLKPPTSRMRRLAPLFVPALAVTLLPGCVSPKFERAWKEAGEQAGSAAPVAAGGPRTAGDTAPRLAVPTRWQGRWHSDKRDGGGRLRAVVQPPVDGRAEIFFEAGWHGFTTAYPVSLSATKKGKAYELAGEHNLRSCVGGGVYHYTGSLGADAVSAKYRSDYDTGTFQLSPVPATGTQPAAKH